MPSNDDNRADQMNPNNDAYWESRGYDERPHNWDDWEDEDDDCCCSNCRPLDEAGLSA